MGSVLARLRPSPGKLPAFVTMPWTVMHPAAPGGRAPGQNGGWLGRRYDPLAIEGDPGSPGFQVPGLEPLPGVPPVRLARRRRLLAALDGPGGAAEHPALRDLRGFQERALDIIGSRDARAAFDLSREDDRTRDRYGRHIHGNCLLLARRLVERGVPLVTVNWLATATTSGTRGGTSFRQLKNHLLPPADMGFSALIGPEARGLLGGRSLSGWEPGTPRSRSRTLEGALAALLPIVLAGEASGRPGSWRVGQACFIRRACRPGNIAATVYHAPVGERRTSGLTQGASREAAGTVDLTQGK
jgi:hypothetical protein